MAKTDFEDHEAVVRWLVSPAAQGLLAQYDPDAIGRPQVIEKLRADIGSIATRLIAQQVELRGRGGVKFARADSMFFTSLGLQQATDEVIAGYKASRFPADVPLADLCCGIGGDLISLCGRGPTVGVDLSSEHLVYAAANCKAYETAPVACRQVAAETIDVADFAAWHLDPDRRATSGRTVRLEHCSPGLEDIDRLLAQNPQAGIKLAPATAVPDHWQEHIEAEWISHRRECKQLVVWSGSLATEPGTHRATKLQAGQVATFVGRPGLPQVTVAEIRQLVIDPDPALVAAGLVDAFAGEQGLARVSAAAHYLTGHRGPEHGLVQSFEVLETLPLDRKAIQQAVRQHEIGTLEIKKRGIEIDLPKLRKRLKLAGPHERTLILTPTPSGNRAIVCRRVENENGGPPKGAPE